MDSAIDRCKLKPEQLRKRIDASSLGFESTAEVKPLEEIVGQDRALDAIDLALGISAPGYHLYLSGDYGLGKESLIKQKLESVAADAKTVLHDLVYVNNFQNPSEPLLLTLPAKEGNKLKSYMTMLKLNISEKLKNIDADPKYQQQVDNIQRKCLGKIMEIKKEIDSIVNSNKDIMPFLSGEIIVGELDEENKGNYSQEDFERMFKLRDNLSELETKLEKLTDEMNRVVRNSKIRCGKEIIGDIFKDIRGKFNINEIADYLAEAEKSYINRIPLILRALENEGQDVLLQVQGSSIPLKSNVTGMPPTKEYDVNVIVNNSKTTAPTVIFESDPTFNQVFGGIEEKVTAKGMIRAGFMDIRAGSIHKANGGYIVLDLLAVLKQPYVYEKLMESLKARKTTIVSSPLSIFRDNGLKPQPIPLELKVILTGEPWLFHILSEYDPRFAEMFQLADFEEEIKLDDAVIKNYAGFIAKTCKENNLNDFDASGVAAVIEYAMREAKKQDKVTLKFGDIKHLVLEAHYWAQKEQRREKSENKEQEKEELKSEPVKEGSASEKAEDKNDGPFCIVTDRHVEKAVESMRRRFGFYDDYMKEMILDGSLMIDTDGKKTGQINGLSVVQIGKYKYGKPARITAVTAVGNNGVVHVERKTKKSGSIHDKGVFELQGYMQHVFGQDKKISLLCSLTFEQNYSAIDGDSASSTEAYALLSSLAGAPIKQGIAVTGSVNQFGEIQPIGGVNEKVEGFYDVCNERGLTGEQGVMIPPQNIKYLMLRRDIVDAVKEGVFHIYAPVTIEDGIEILTGIRAGTINEKGTIYYKANEQLKYNSVCIDKRDITPAKKGEICEKKGFWRKIFRNE